MKHKAFIVRFIIALTLLFLASIALPYLIGGKVKTITVQTAELETLLGEMAWVSPGLGDTPALYKISFRTCSACVSYHKTEFPKLQTMGVDTRQFVFARAHRPEQNPDEWAVVAELYKNRSWKLSEKWWKHSNPKRFYKTMDTVPPADLDRQWLVVEGREQMDKLRQILTANDITMATPTLLWQNGEGQWRVAIGDNPVSNAQIRKELGGAK